MSRVKLGLRVKHCDLVANYGQGKQFTKQIKKATPSGWYVHCRYGNKWYAIMDLRFMREKDALRAAQALTAAGLDTHRALAAADPLTVKQVATEFLQWLIPPRVADEVASLLTGCRWAWRNTTREKLTMAFYKFNRDLPQGQVLRSGLDALRDGRDKLIRVRDAMNQMTDDQIVDVFGVAPTKVGGDDATTQAAALKSELASDVGSFDSIKTQIGQLLAQTG